MGSIPVSDDVLGLDEPTYLLAEVADLLGVPVTRVHQQLRDGQLVAVRRGGATVVPRIFFADGAVVKSLPGLLAVLHDGGYRDTEIVRWLFTADPSLTVTRDGGRSVGGVDAVRPVDALHTDQAREVVRRAQAMAY